MPYGMKVLLADLKRHEAVRSRLYFDPLGILTVGVGHALGSRPVPADIRDAMSVPGVMDTPFHPDVVDLLLVLDATEADKQVRNLAALRGVDFDALTPARQMALVGMGFNLGVNRLGGFSKMWEALARGDYLEAAAQMKDSLWHRQVGLRAVELEAIMRKG